jgi:hypothetical protein
MSGLLMHHNPKHIYSSDPVAMAVFPSAATIQLNCLHCGLEFSGTKKPIGNRDRNTFIVKITGLSLHLCASNCQGASRKFYKVHNHLINEFSSSILQVAGLCPQSESHPSLTNIDNFSEAASSFECPDADSVDKSLPLEPTRGASTNNLISHSLDFSSTLLGKYITANGHGNKTTTSIYSFSVPKNHFLDKVLFHQMHVPYIPNTAKYSASTFLEGAFPNL